MGVDAEMFIGVNAPIPEPELKRLSFMLGSSFYGETFLNLRRPLQLAGEDVEIFDVPGEFKQVLRVSLVGRFYGPGYERGPLWTYLAIARWLRDNIKGAVIFYGGDSGGESIRELTPEYETELWKHFTTHGHLPYQQFFDREKDGPNCEICEFPMIRNGWGGGGAYKAWFCSACGASLAEKDGTRYVPEKGSF